MEYRLIFSDEPDRLQAEVNRLIAEGWAPMGGVAISMTASPVFVYQRFAQAMIKDKLLETIIRGASSSAAEE